MLRLRRPGSRSLAACLITLLLILCVTVSRTPGAPLYGSVLPEPILHVRPSFPPLLHTVFPVSAIPDWGNIHSAALWNRPFDQIPVSEFVPVPPYQPEMLTEPYTTLLLHPGTQSRQIITEKLFYSTRHMGQYDVDSAEFSGTHNGVDLKLARGTPVSVIAGGRVLQAGWSGSFGKRVAVEHRAADGYRFVSLYAHLKDIAVKPGQDLQPSDLIGTVGTTGHTTGPHLHLQVDVWPYTQPVYRPFIAKRRMTPHEVALYAVNPVAFIDHYQSGDTQMTAKK